MKPQLRLASLVDLPALQQLFVLTIRHTCQNDYTKQQIEAWSASVKNRQRWTELVEQQYVLVAESAGQIAGFGSLENEDYLDFLFVHPDFLRQGIASLLFEGLKKEAMRKGATKMSADVSITARPFFERQGFLVVRENRNKIRGIEINNFKMELTF
jgi:putative acetyltransferase